MSFKTSLRNSSSEHLVEEEEEEKYDIDICPHCGEDSLEIPPRKLQSRILPTIFWTMITVFTILGMASIFIPSRIRLFSAKQTDSNQRPSLYTPFADGIRYEIETASPDYWNSDLYMGEPSEESERAWKTLIHPGREHGVRLLREEGAHLNINKSILLPDNNFAVIITVHHNLHCLRRLRQSFFQDHYYPGRTDTDRMHDREHSLHCLESLRQSMICQPDVAPLPYYWSGNAWHDMNASPDVKRECVNWEFFSEYLKTRGYHYDDLIKDWE